MNNYNILTDLMTDICRMEGIRLYVYDDATGQAITKGYTVKGHPTIGYGRALDCKGITQTEALTMLDDDCTNIITWAIASLSWYSGLSEIRQRVICNMIYQLGRDGFLGFHDLAIAIQNRDWQDAATAMLNSVWAIKETPTRATMLANWFLTDTIC